MRKHFLTWALLAASLLPASADRWTSLIYARYLTLTTTSGATYYYIAGNSDAATMHLRGTEVVVGRDTFGLADIRSMRIKDIDKFILDEDSLKYGGSAVSHGMLALRRTLTQNQWNSLVLPVSLTGTQVRDAFGEDAMLATVRGFREGETAIVDYETIGLNTDEVVMQANYHYIIWPTREPDLADGKKATTLEGRPQGPIYLIPDVTVAAKQLPKSVSFSSKNRETTISQRGTYYIKDGSSVFNKKLDGSSRPVYVFGDDGLLAMHTDSVLVKAFSSWFIDLSSEPGVLQFYIDGVSEGLTAIDPLTVSSAARKDDDRVYDLHGRLMGRQRDDLQLPKGIYVRNGRKFIVK